MSSSEKDVKRLFVDPPRERQMHRLIVDSGNPLTEIVAIDGQFKLVARGEDGHLDCTLPAGQYLIRLRIGDRLAEHWVRLDQNRTEHFSLPPAFGSADPTPSEVPWRSADLDAAEAFFGGALTVVIRDPEVDDPASWTDEVTIRRPSGEVVARLEGTSVTPAEWDHPRSGSIAGLGGQVEPGCYLLRVSTPGLGAYEMAVWVAPHYETRVFLTRRLIQSCNRSARAAHLATAAVYVVRPDVTRETLLYFAELALAVRTTLAHERPLMPYDNIVEAVSERADCPMLGVLGAHLLRLNIDRHAEKNRNVDRARSLLDRVLPNLDRLLPQWPDVGVLLGANRPSRYDAPPMLVQSWSLLAPAASDNLIPPGSYSFRIAPAVTAVRPWLVWNTQRMLPGASQTQLDLGRIREVKRSLAQDMTRQDEIAQMIRHTPDEDFSDLDTLSQTWKLPVSSLRAVLEAVDAAPESPAHVTMEAASVKPVDPLPFRAPGAAPASVRIIAVIGATGSQGGGLCRAIFGDASGGFGCRAITRDPDKREARALKAAGAEVVRADVDDVESLKRAFAGVYGVFGVTNFWEHLSPEREKDQARNIADAARAAGVAHVIWSTLEDTRKLMRPEDHRMPWVDGKYRVPHFDAKAEADAYFQGLPVTYLVTSFYWDNLYKFDLAPKKNENGIYTWTLPTGNAKVPGIAAEDIGKAAYAIFKGGPQFIGKTMGLASENLTFMEISRKLSAGLGVTPVEYKPVDADSYRGLGFRRADAYGNMFQVFRDFEDEIVAARNIELTRALVPGVQTFDTWLQMNKAKVLPKMEATTTEK